MSNLNVWDVQFEGLNFAMSNCFDFVNVYQC